MAALANNSTATVVRGWRAKSGWLGAILTAGALAGGMATDPAWGAGDNSRSSSIALNRSGDRLFVANREADSLTVFAVDGGHDKAAKGIVTY